MKKYLLFSIIVFSAWWFLGSAHTTEAATINAASCSYADVSAAISAAAPEDTVQVPIGNCTWSSTLTITKGINLIGSGIGNTIITSNMASGPDAYTAPLINYSPAAGYRAANYHFRVSGFTFDSGGNSTTAFVLSSGDHFPPQSKIRIDHNRIYNSSFTSGYGVVFKDVRGVVDNNVFESPGSTIPIRSWGSRGTQGLASWQNYGNLVFGTANDNMYFEDNVFTNGCNKEVISDNDEGGRYVFRYNTANIPDDNWCGVFDIHGGKQQGAYSAMGGEIYGNTIIGDSTGRFMAQRGGRLVLFYNSWETTKSVGINLYNSEPDGCPPGEDPIYSAQLINNTYFWNNRKNSTGGIVDATITLNYCYADPIVEGASFWDDTTNNGVRKGTLANIPQTCTTGQGYWATNQSTTDLTGMVGASPTTPISGTLYKCTSANTWTAYYTPYTYPHPLRLETTLFFPEQYIEAENGTISTPMQTGSDSGALGGQYIYTTMDEQGSVSFTFNIQQPGEYMMSARTNANNDAGQNSFYLGLDGEAANGNNNNVYDAPITSTFTWNDISLRGFVANPMTWTLSAGLHAFTFYGRESNTWLDQIILKRVTADTTPPAAPQNVKIL